MVSACALAYVPAGTGGCNVLRGESTDGEYVDDVAITTAVKYELLESKKVDGLYVIVDMKGVKSVDNQIKIKT